MNKMLTSSAAYVLVLSGLFISQTAAASDPQSGSGSNDIAAVLAQELKLDDKQTQQVRAEMQKYGAQLEKLFAEQEAEDADPQKLIAGVKQAQDAHNKALQSILSEEQFKAYKALKEKAIKGVLSDLIEIQLMDVQPKTSLSNEQVSQLAPILADSKYKIIGIAWQHAGQELRPRQKIQLAKQIKGIQRDTRAGLEKVLTPEQLQAWDKYMEEQKSKK